jgi:divalent metal cation (Fe/Co/Zn/Cd) transporter
MEEDKHALKKMDDPSKIALLSTLLNILVAGTKGILAWLSGSAALLADTIHGFSDTLPASLYLWDLVIEKKSEAFPWVFTRLKILSL